MSIKKRFVKVFRLSTAWFMCIYAHSYSLQINILPGINFYALIHNFINIVYCNALHHHSTYFFLTHHNSFSSVNIVVVVVSTLYAYAAFDGLFVRVP